MLISNIGESTQQANEHLGHKQEPLWERLSHYLLSSISWHNAGEGDMAKVLVFKTKYCSVVGKNKIKSEKLTWQSWEKTCYLYNNRKRHLFIKPLIIYLLSFWSLWCHYDGLATAKVVKHFPLTWIICREWGNTHLGEAAELIHH